MAELAGAQPPRLSVPDGERSLETVKGLRPVWAQVDLGALRHNVRLLRRIAAPAQLCAVVKADAYGHGAVSLSHAALEAGAACVAVATVEEGMELRVSGIAAPVLVLSEPPPTAMDVVAAHVLSPTLYSTEGVRAAQRAAAARSVVLDVHVKLDTGMHRVGASPEEIGSVLAAVRDAPQLRMVALWTHLAVADGTSEEDRVFTLSQLEALSQLAAGLGDLVSGPVKLHAANSAACMRSPESRLDMVRCGIALYGSAPSAEMEAASTPGAHRVEEDLLVPVMSLRSQVTHLRWLEAGERPSYGRLRALESRSVVATVPIGYADGLPRRLFDAGATVLLGGRRRPLAGAVTMDQIVIDCGADEEVSVGDEVVLIGSQGAETITAWEWARALGTISYEVFTGVGPRVPRLYVDSESSGAVPGPSGVPG